MAHNAVTVTIKCDSSDWDRATAKMLEESIATAVEPAVKRELKKQLAILRDGEAQS